MNGVEVRIPVIESRDTRLGTDNLGTQNAGSVELWRDDERIVELVWYEKDGVDLDTLLPNRSLYTAVTIGPDIHHSTHQLRSRS